MQQQQEKQQQQQLAVVQPSPMVKSPLQQNKAVKLDESTLAAAFRGEIIDFNKFNDEEKPATAVAMKTVQQAQQQQQEQQINCEKCNIVFFDTLAYAAHMNSKEHMQQLRTLYAKELQVLRDMGINATTTISHRDTMKESEEALLSLIEYCNADVGKVIDTLLINNNKQ